MATKIKIYNPNRLTNANHACTANHHCQFYTTELLEY